MRRYLKKRTAVPKTIAFQGIGFPSKQLVTLKYADKVSVTVTGGVPTLRSWWANSLYSPDAGGGGHQPLYFDQYMALYQHYCVIGSSFKARVIPLDVNSNYVSCTALVNDTSSTSNQDPEYIVELTQGHTMQYFSGATGPATLRKKWSAKKYFGKSPLANVDLQGTSTSNPTEGSFYCIVAQVADESTTLTFKIEVEISYIVIFKELKPVAQS